jgi:ubiquinol-cytochrome c reductase cytochrome b subunit
MLRAVPDKLLGAMTMAAGVVVPLFLPWLDRSRVNSIRYRGWLYKLALTIFTTSFLMLAWLGTQPATGIFVLMTRVFTTLYFGFFLLMPYYTVIDKTKPVPERVVWHG